LVLKRQNSYSERDFEFMDWHSVDCEARSRQSQRVKAIYEKQEILKIKKKY